MPFIVALLLALGLIIWAAAYVLGLRHKVTKPNGLKRIPLWTKLIMIALVLSIAAWGLLRGYTPVGLVLLIGLIFGALGDLVLAGVFPLQKPELAGMGVFAIGHAFYIAAPLMPAPWPPLLLVGTVALGLVIAVIGWRLLAHNPTGSQRLNIGSLIYGCVLMVTVTVAVVGAVVNAFWVFAVGVIIFAASDMLLAQYMLKGSGPPKLRDLVWGLYSTGQMLIALSIWVLTPLSRAVDAGMA